FLFHHHHPILRFFIFFSITPPPQTSPLFPYTTLFRSVPGRAGRVDVEIEQIRFADNGGELANLLAADDVVDRGKRLTSRARLNRDRKSTRLNSSHLGISYAVFCLKKKKQKIKNKNSIN